MAEFITHIDENVAVGENGELCMKANFVQELIRCENCLHYITGGFPGRYCDYDFCIRPKDGFCHRAERKES